MQRLQRRVLAMVVLALVLAAVPTAAQAKGASAATISGGGPGGLPGGPIDLKGDGEPGSGTDLANLAEASGVFALLFEDSSTGALFTSAPLVIVAPADDPAEQARAATEAVELGMPMLLAPAPAVPATPSPGPSPTAPATRTRSASLSGRTRPAVP